MLSWPRHQSERETGGALRSEERAPLKGKQDPAPVAVVLVLDVVTAGVGEEIGASVELAAAATEAADMDDRISL